MEPSVSHTTAAGTVYRCSTCGGRYCRPPIQMSCCVQHSANECCHFGELPVTKKGWIKRERVVSA